MHLLTQSALLRALGWSLFNSLWQMAFLWLVYFSFQYFFRRSSAHFRHGLAVLLLVTGTIWTGTTFFNAFISAGDSSMYELGVPYFSDSHWTAGFLLTCRQLINEALPYGSVLYLLVLCVLFVRYIQQYLFSRRLMHSGLSKAGPEIRIFTEQVARRLGIKKEIKVWLSTLVDGPVTLGSLKPVVLIPLAAISQLTPHQVEALILHELAHIRRHDYLLHIGMAVLEVIFFFNPFAKLLIHCIQQEREHRCDDMVMQFQEDRHTYVSALLSIAKGLPASPRLALAATGSNDKLLLRRVRRILQLAPPKEPVKGRPILLFFLTVVMTVLALTRTTVMDEPIIVPDEAAIAQPAVMKENTAVSPASGETMMVSVVSYNITAKRHAATPAAGKRTLRMPRHLQKNSDEEGVVYIYDDAPAQEEDATDEEDAGNSMIGFASAPVQEVKRVYSIKTVAASHDVRPVDKQAAAVTVISTSEGCALQMPAPYVPNSSFSCQTIQDSSALPIEQSTHLQQLATRQVEEAVTTLQKELQRQLKLMNLSNAQQRPELVHQRQILLAQLKLQQQYLIKQQELQKQLEKMGKKKKVIIVI